MVEIQSGGHEITHFMLRVQATHRLRAYTIATCQIGGVQRMNAARNEFQIVALDNLYTVSWKRIGFQLQLSSVNLILSPNEIHEIIRGARCSVKSYVISHSMHLPSNPQRSLILIIVPPRATASHGRHVALACTTINLKILALNFC